MNRELDKYFKKIENRESRMNSLSIELEQLETLRQKHGELSDILAYYDGRHDTLTDEEWDDLEVVSLAIEDIEIQMYKLRQIIGE